LLHWVSTMTTATKNPTLATLKFTSLFRLIFIHSLTHSPLIHSFTHSLTHSLYNRPPFFILFAIKSANVMLSLLFAKD
jgi:hypothetical protein